MIRETLKFSRASRIIVICYEALDGMIMGQSDDDTSWGAAQDLKELWLRIQELANKAVLERHIRAKVGDKLRAIWGR